MKIEPQLLWVLLNIIIIDTLVLTSILSISKGFKRTVFSFKKFQLPVYWKQNQNLKNLQTCLWKSKLLHAYGIGATWLRNRCWNPATGLKKEPQTHIILYTFVKPCFTKVRLCFTKRGFKKVSCVNLQHIDTVPTSNC